MATTGKNDSCPCGSGRTYEKCCYGGDILKASGRMDAKTFSQAIGALMEGRQFSSLEEANAELDRLTRARNTAPLNEFCGLSPEQMNRFLYHPFDSSGLIDFNLALTSFPDSQFFRLFTFLLNATAKDELKATSQGNLPVKFVKDAAQWYYGEQGYQERRRYISFRTETDFAVLHTVRLIAVMSGFIRKQKGCFHLTKNGAAVLENGMDGRAFFKIFKGYTGKFNWGYNDRYPELYFVQHAFLFTLFVLKKYGDIFRPASFYENLFLTAFPKVIREVPEVPYDTREDTLKHCFTLRSLSRFGHFFGFVELSDPKNDRWIEKLEIKKTPFLDGWVRFSINGQSSAAD
jgi:hypothetical protein